MEPLNIASSKSTPYVYFDADAATLHIKGESYPENAAKFYEPILTWLARWLETSGQKWFQVDFELLYYNSSSSKAIMNLFDLLEEAADRDWKITVHWRFDEENEIIRESGEEFQMDYDAIDVRLTAFSR